MNYLRTPLILSSLLLTTNSSAIADEALTVYGKLFITVQASEEGDDQFSEIKSNASRIGVKGKSKLSDALEGFYKLEWEVDVTDKSGSDNIKSRNQIIGVRGSFGEVFVGRSDTPMKKLGKKVEIFNDLESDIKSILNGEVRASNLVQYTTPKFENGFGARVAVVSGEDPVNGRDSLSDSSSIAVTYDQDNLSLGIIFDSDVDSVGTATTRFVSQYKIDALKFGFLYQTTDNGTTEEDGFVFSTTYTHGKNTYKLQHADSDINSLGVNSKVKYSNQTTLGIDHKLNKKAKLFGFYAAAENQAGIENNYLAIGIEYNF